MLSPTAEKNIIQSGYSAVVGIDEAGRGAWAGPVAVGYYVFTANQAEIDGIKDSKQLSPRRRAEQSALLEPHGGVVYKSAIEIDSLGITNAISTAIFDIFELVHNKFTPQNVYFLIDGRFAAKFPTPHQQIIKGDTTHYSIAAASILAKHGRDSQMLQLHEQYPHYGFNKHKGYGTKLHSQMIENMGITPQHRTSFAPMLHYSV